MKNYGLLWLFFILLTVGCKKENTFVRQENRSGYTVTTIDIPELQPVYGPMKLTDVMTNARIIPLETTSQCLIGGQAKYYIGSSFILVFQEENIALFDANGRFLRIVAEEGRGAKEYMDCRDFCVDEANNLLFVLSGYPRNRVLTYHLQDSAYFKQIEPIEPKGLNAISCMDDGSLLLVPKPSKEVKYQYYQQTPTGELGKHALCHSDKEGFSTSQRLLYKLGDLHSYVSLGDMFSIDTAFTITPDGLQPRWIFGYNVSKKYTIAGETPDLLFFTYNVFKSSVEEDLVGGIGKSITHDFDIQDFCYHKKNGELTVIDGFIDDYFSGMNWPFYLAHFQNGRVFYIEASPMTILQDMKKSSGQTKYPEKWREIVYNLNDEDNPVLLIGELK